MGGDEARNEMILPSQAVLGHGTDEQNHGAQRPEMKLS
jgi:hypothetical protein